MSLVLAARNDHPAPPHKLLTFNGQKTRVVRAVERNVPIALISMELWEFYKIGQLTDSNTPYGMMMSAHLPLFMGPLDPINIEGIAVPLTGSFTDVVLPIGTLALPSGGIGRADKCA